MTVFKGMTYHKLNFIYEIHSSLLVYLFGYRRNKGLQPLVFETIAVG